MSVPAAVPERASPPAIPAPTRQQERELVELADYQHERKQVERRRQLRGLLLLALIVLAVSIARAGLDRVFPPSWWHLW